MFSSHASPYAAKTLKIILTHRVYPHCSMSSCHHTEQSGDNNIKCGDRTRGGGAAELQWGSSLLLTMQCPGLAAARDSGDCRGTAQEAHETS